MVFLVKEGFDVLTKKGEKERKSSMCDLFYGFVGVLCGCEEGVWPYQSVKIENILPLKPFAMVYCKG